MIKVCPYCTAHVDCSQLPRRNDRVTCPSCMGKFTPEVERGPDDPGDDIAPQSNEPTGPEGDDSARNQDATASGEISGETNITIEGGTASPAAGDEQAGSQESDEERLRREARNAKRRELAAQKRLQAAT